MTGHAAGETSTTLLIDCETDLDRGGRKEEEVRELVQRPRPGNTGEQPSPFTGLLQRKCACGRGTGSHGTCSECRQKKDLGMQASGTIERSVGDADPIHGQAATVPERATFHMRSVPGHNFGRVAVREKSGTFEGDENGPGERTTASAGTGGNRIDFTFDPSTSNPVPQCDRIVFVQLIKMTADGSSLKPGSYYTPWACRDVAALTDGSYIDHDCPCNTPYYTDCFNGTAGSSGAATATATSFDAPQTGGGTKGFASAANPTGWNTVVYSFRTHAFCAEGAECGMFYDGIQWDYTKTAADHAAGSVGTSTATASVTPAGPGTTIQNALNKFDSAKGFTPCAMSVRPRNP